MLNLQDMESTDQQIGQLMEYLKENNNVSIIELMGLFAAIVTSPHDIGISEWMQLLSLNKGYRSIQQRDEIYVTLCALYKQVEDELKSEDYGPRTLKVLQESDMPADQIKTFYLLWGKGYITGIDSVCNETGVAAHEYAYNLFVEVTQSIRSLYDNENQPIRKKDFEIVRTHTKAIYDFWVEHRTCLGQVNCVVSINTPKSDGLIKKFLSWF